MAKPTQRHEASTRFPGLLPAFGMALLLSYLCAPHAGSRELERVNAASLEDFYSRYIEQPMPQRNSRGYVQPDAAARKELRELFTALQQSDDWTEPELHTRAAALGFTLVRVEAGAAQSRVLAMLESAAMRGATTRGWCAILHQPDASADVLVETPYPVNNRDTGVLGIRLFTAMPAKWLVIAGSHRYAAPPRGALAPVSDAGAWSTTPFHLAHEMLARSRPAVQVRGWTRGKGAAWDRYPDLVLTPGRQGSAGLELVTREVDRNGASAGLFGGAGLGTSTLSGEGNVQFTCDLGTPFVMLFLESELRTRLLGQAGEGVLNALVRGLRNWSGAGTTPAPPVQVNAELVPESAIPAGTVTSEITWEPLVQPADSEPPAAAVATLEHQPPAASADASGDEADANNPQDRVALRDVEIMLVICGILLILAVAAAVIMGWLWLRSERMRLPVMKRLLKTQRDLQQLQQQSERRESALTEQAERLDEQIQAVKRLERDVNRERQLKEQFLTAYNKLVKTTNDLESRLRETQPRRQMSIPYAARLQAALPATGAGHKPRQRAGMTGAQKEQDQRDAARIRKIQTLLFTPDFSACLAGILFAAAGRVPEAIDAVGRIMRDSEDQRLRLAAVWALGELQAVQETDRLLTLSRCTDPFLSQAAVEALAKLGYAAAGGAAPSNGADRWFTPQAVFRDTPFRTRSEFLMMHLADPEDELRALALHALSCIGIQPYLGLFLEALQDQSPEVRYEAAALLGAMPIERGSALLMDIDVRNRVAGALLRRQQEESHPHVRDAAALALQRLQA